MSDNRNHKRTESADRSGTRKKPVSRGALPDEKKRASEQEKRLLKQKNEIMRKMRKRENSLLCFNISAIIGVFAFITLFMTFGTRSTVSAEEQRELAKMPKFSLESYFKGSFTNDFAEFYNDTVPMRSSLMSFVSEFRAKMGIKYEGVEIIGQFPVIDEPPPSNPSPSVPTPPDTQDPPTSTPQSPQVSSSEPPVQTTPEPKPVEGDGEISGTVMVTTDGRGLSLFGGSYTGAEYYAKALNKVKQGVGDDINVYSLVAPNSCSFYMPEKFKDKIGSEYEHIKYINGLLQGVIPVDAYGALAAHTDEHIYSRTDHHWQPLGAYYAAEEFAKTADVGFAPLSDYEKISRDGYVGTMYAYSNYNSTIKDNPETFTYYVPQNEYTTTDYDNYAENGKRSSLFYHIDWIDKPVRWYGVFVGGIDAKVVRVQTDCQNGRKLLIVKDSYGNALLPCFTNSFEEIWMVDMRFFERSVVNFSKDNGITDILFAMNTFSAEGGNRTTFSQKQADAELAGR